jgi:nucleotide-binding universal stress UspA family protein
VGEEEPELDRLLQRPRQDGTEPFVVGSRGGRGLRRLLLGSVASAVARDARCSVLVARPRL